MNFSTLAIATFSLLNLSACGVAVIAGGSMENEIEATVDMNSLTPTIQNMMQKAKTLGIVAGDRSDVKAADMFETKGGYAVKIDRQTAKAGELTGSERRAALAQVCSTHKVDVAMLGHIVKTETGNTFVAAAFTGRAKVSTNWVMDLLDCKNNSNHSFNGVFRMNMGIFNQKAQTEVDEIVGAEVGTKILAALGRAGGAPIAQSAPYPPGNTALAESGMAKTTSATAPRSVAQDEVAKPDSRLQEAQRRLQTRGYKVGATDGFANADTTAALKKFQRDNKLGETGLLDDPTFARLVPKAGASAAKSVAAKAAASAPAAPAVAVKPLTKPAGEL